MRWLRPIPQDWIPWHLLLFITLCALGLALRGIEQLPLHQRSDAIGFTNSMIDGSVSIILVAATVSTTVVEGALIFAEKYLKHRFEKGREEGREEGVDELERERWIDWNKRSPKQAAEAAGEPFDEPYACSKLKRVQTVPSRRELLHPMTKVLVTGGSGKMGQVIVRDLLS